MAINANQFLGTRIGTTYYPVLKKFMYYSKILPFARQILSMSEKIFFKAIGTINL